MDDPLAPFRWHPEPELIGVRDSAVSREALERILGPIRFIRETRLTVAKPGIVTGLAWTPVGGEIMHIEALRYAGKGGIMLTGQLGSVMRESA